MVDFVKCVVYEYLGGEEVVVVGIGEGIQVGQIVGYGVNFIGGVMDLQFVDQIGGLGDFIVGFECYIIGYVCWWFYEWVDCVVFLVYQG